MFSGFRDVDSADQSSSSPGNSPGSSGGSSSSRAFGPGQGPAKARLQDKQIEKGRSIMMRDYVSVVHFDHRASQVNSSMTVMFVMFREQGRTRLAADAQSSPPAPNITAPQTQALLQAHLRNCSKQVHCQQEHQHHGLHACAHILDLQPMHTRGQLYTNQWAIYQCQSGLARLF
jgi:hypothetical protein